MANFSDDALNALRDRQIAFFHARLVSAVAEGEWRANMAAAYDALLGRPLGELMTPAGLAALVEAALARSALDGAAAPLSRALHAHGLAQASVDATRVGDYVPEAARAAIDGLIARPGLVPERLLREVLEQEAMEEVMRDVLHDALKQFNESVNPFFAEWGLPALLKRLMPIGSGAVLKSLEAVKAEFDKRLEPEIKKFLQGFSRKALRKMADVLVQTQDEPKSIAVRRAVATWIYDQEVRSFVQGHDAHAASEAHRAAMAIAAHVGARDATRARLRQVIDGFLARHGQSPAREVLATFKVTARPDFDALAAASWPLVRAALESEPVRAWFATLIEEFFRQEAGA